VRRYERDRPGELVHVDVKKLGNIPDGGGWRAHGRATGQQHRRATSPTRNPSLGYSYLHTALDDRSRLAYTEILADERKDTAAAFLHRAHAWYAVLGITIERVLSDNGGCYRSRDWAAACVGRYTGSPSGGLPLARMSAQAGPVTGCRTCCRRARAPAPPGAAG
jgi:hypothetical protein